MKMISNGDVGPSHDNYSTVTSSSSGSSTSSIPDTKDYTNVSIPLTSTPKSTTSPMTELMDELFKAAQWQNVPPATSKLTSTTALPSNQPNSPTVVGSGVLPAVGMFNEQVGLSGSIQQRTEGLYGKSFSPAITIEQYDYKVAYVLDTICFEYPTPIRTPIQMGH